MISNRFFRLSALAAALALTATASATERRFTYNYETTTTPQGKWEIENWVTWSKFGVPGRSDLNLMEFRHELEVGLTDRLQLGIYLFDWQYNSQDEEHHRARWAHSGAELIYQFTNPNTAWLGSAAYLELQVGESSIELEGKLLFQKNITPNLRAVANLVLESEWEGEKFGHYDEAEGEFSYSLGISYDLNKHFSIGAELLQELPMPEWQTNEESWNIFVGPNASVRYGNFFATVTALAQITNNEGEPDFQVRLITGFDF